MKLAESLRAVGGRKRLFPLLAPDSAGAQQEHNKAQLPMALPVDLQEVINAWAELPEAIRAGVLALIRAAR